MCCNETKAANIVRRSVHRHRGDEKKIIKENEEVSNFAFIAKLNLYLKERVFWLFGSEGFAVERAKKKSLFVNLQFFQGKLETRRDGHRPIVL